MVMYKNFTFVSLSAILYWSSLTNKHVRARTTSLKMEWCHLKNLKLEIIHWNVSSFDIKRKFPWLICQHFHICRYTPSVPSVELRAEMQRDGCLEHENVDTIDCSNFVDLDWLSSGTSCEEESLERYSYLESLEFLFSLRYYGWWLLGASWTGVIFSRKMNDVTLFPRYWNLLKIYDQNLWLIQGMDHFTLKLAISLFCYLASKLSCFRSIIPYPYYLSFLASMYRFLSYNFSVNL